MVLLLRGCINCIWLCWACDAMRCDGLEGGDRIRGGYRYRRPALQLQLHAMYIHTGWAGWQLTEAPGTGHWALGSALGTGL